jgi:hypothetical protein
MGSNAASRIADSVATAADRLRRKKGIAIPGCMRDDRCGRTSARIIANAPKVEAQSR